ncbi:MAG: DHH family phosphoesterase [candidate division WOR-3 bacterium]
MEGNDLIKRLIENPKLLLPDLEPSFYQYENIERFFEILEEKKEIGEKILIIGHEDVDGIASLFGMEILIKEIGLNFKTYLPSRENESYGISDKVIERLKDENFDFLITVDCGLSNVMEIKHLRELGFDVFVIDHHFEGNFEEENLIHPFKGKGFPFLSNGVLIFILLFKKFGENLWKEKKFFDFVYLSGLSVLSDKVPICSVNQYVLNKSESIFPETEIYKIFNEVNMKPPQFKEISKIIPLIPARNGTHLILDFLRESEVLGKKKIMREIISTYIEEQKNFEESLFISKNSIYTENNINFIISKNINPRYAGWIAGRFLKENNFPSICITRKNNEWIGEARSKPPLSVLKLLRETSFLFEEFGGHPFACGFRIKEENIEPLIKNIKILSGDLKNFIPEPDLILDEKEFKELREILEKISKTGINFYIKVGEKIFYSTKEGILTLKL